MYVVVVVLCEHMYRWCYECTYSYVSGGCGAMCVYVSGGCGAMSNYLGG